MLGLAYVCFDSSELGVMTTSLPKADQRQDPDCDDDQDQAGGRHGTGHDADGSLLTIGPARFVARLASASISCMAQFTTA
ncbi:MAG: hypothetical protein M3O32_00380 [Actinomycetota bacterium]|nr:hypothetical protein [Actinomycetota bacterium]